MPQPDAPSGSGGALRGASAHERAAARAADFLAFSGASGYFRDGQVTARHRAAETIGAGLVHGEA